MMKHLHCNGALKVPMNTPQRRAFTLIELLVVIAIIAILAAILFPVFTNAKLQAKKTQSLSNLKNTVLATLMYQNNDDDLFPQGTSWVPARGEWNWNYLMPVPATQLAASEPAWKRDAAATFVFNAIQPYMKNNAIYECPGGTRIARTGSYTPATIPSSLPGTTYTYNGLMNSYPSTAVANPTGAILFWHGHGKRSMIGIGYTSPWLVCNTPGDCVYIPPKAGCLTGGLNGQTSGYTTNSSKTGLDVFGNTIVMAFTDGHAKSRVIGVNGTPNARTDPRTDPWGSYSGKYASGRYWDSLSCHVYLFRPDLDGSNWDSATYYPGGADL